LSLAHPFVAAITVVATAYAAATSVLLCRATSSEAIQAHNMLIADCALSFICFWLTAIIIAGSDSKSQPTQPNGPSRRRPSNRNITFS
jgi:hypothetical protein